MRSMGSKRRAGPVACSRGCKLEQAMLTGTGNRQKPRALPHGVVDRNRRPWGSGGGRPGKGQFSFLACKIRVASHSFTHSRTELVSCEAEGHFYGLGNPQARREQSLCSRTKCPAERARNKTNAQLINMTSKSLGVAQGMGW